MRYEEFIESNLLCVVVDNNPSAGNFYRDPGPITGLRAFCNDHAMPPYTWMQYGLCTPDSQRFSSASSSPAFVVGDAIPLAELTDFFDTSVKTSFGGYLTIPIGGVDGLCNDQNPVGFMQPIETVCIRQVVDNGRCSDGAFLFNQTVHLLGSNPAAIGNFATDSFVQITTSRVCTYDIEIAAIRNCTSATDNPSEQLQLPHASDTLSDPRRSHAGCQNVLRELHLTITDDSKGRIIAAEVDAVVYGAIEADTAAYATQSFSVSFATVSAEPIETSWETGNLIPRLRSGNAGYKDGFLVNAGTLVTRGNATSGVSAVYMLKEGIRLLAPSASGGCDLSRATGASFRMDEISGCMLSLDLEGLAEVCNAFAEHRELSVNLTDWWTDVIEGVVEPVIGAYGNADPLNAADWIPIEVDDLSATADVTMYNSQRKQCDNIVTSLNVEFMYANMGEESNPQRKIVAARMWYGTDSWRFRQSLSTTPQRFAFYTTVTFAEFPSEQTGAFVPPTPPILPQLPHDLFYPFVLSEASTTYPSLTSRLMGACLGTALYVQARVL